MKELIGNVSFRIILSKDRKRKRPTSTLSNRESNNDRNIDDKRDLVGFVLHCRSSDGQSIDGSTPTNALLLSVPKNLQKQLCDAVRFRRRIRIHQYSFFPCNAMELPSLDASQGLPEFFFVNGIVEIHENGIDLPVDMPFGKLTTKVSDEEVWNLRQILRREAVDCLQPPDLDLQNDPKEAKRYSFRATVKAISPILTMDPSDPFSLAELEDPQSCCSCVVVMTRIPSKQTDRDSKNYLSSLVCHEAIHVGDSIQILQAKRQKWKTPKILEKAGFGDLSRRIPSFVFVVHRADQIQWDGLNIPNSNLPTPTVSSLRGEITKISRISIAECEQVVHYVEINTPMNQSGSTVMTVFLTYYPMTSALQASLRPGATISAENLGQITSSTFYASLRSSLIMDVHARDESIDLAMEGTRPCAFFNVGRSYFELYCRQQVRQWFDEWTFNKEIILPKTDVFVKCLLGIQESRGKRSRRNAYAEFFENVDGRADVSTIKTTLAGYSHDQDGDSLLRIPVALKLAEVHEAVKREFEYLVADFRASDGVQVGSTGSTIRGMAELVSSGRDCFRYIQVETTTSFQISGMLLQNSILAEDVVRCIVSNGNLNVPFVTSVLDHDVTGINFAVMEVRSVVMSFLCLGFEESKDVESNGPARLFQWLPSYCQEKLEIGTQGTSLGITIDGMYCLASYYLEVDRIQPIGACECVKEDDTSGKSKTPVIRVGSILSNLDPSRLYARDTNAFGGLLCRKFFKPQKVRNGSYRGYRMTLSHLDVTAPAFDGASKDIVSSLQTIEVRLSVVVAGEGRRVILRRYLQDLLRKETLNDEQVDMCLAWWKIASSGTTCALLGGGWDEARGNASKLSSARVVVRVPQSAVKIDAKRSYVRFDCRLDELSATSMSYPAHSEVAELNKVDFFGGRRFYPGMLGERHQRRKCSSNSGTTLMYGELLFSPELTAGVPNCSIQQLQLAICDDLKKQKNSRLKPSMVREICGAMFLGVSYCRAFAECTKCFHPLKDVGKTKSYNAKDSSPSFWFLPLPPRGDTSGSVGSRPLSQNSLGSTTTLRCPNNCGAHQNGIKWECSGILDDGTGQAKLYAERDACLMLLGMSQSVVGQIEEGVWLNEKGVMFSKGIPPKELLRSSVLAARGTANDRSGVYHGNQRKIRHVKERDVLGSLDPSIRAEYLMQRHCRSSKEQFRELIYFVRCKPLSDGISHLNQTEIDSFVLSREADSSEGARVLTTDVATYSLPPLKLNLVDCCSPMEEDT